MPFNSVRIMAPTKFARIRIYVNSLSNVTHSFPGHFRNVFTDLIFEKVLSIRQLVSGGVIAINVKLYKLTNADLYGHISMAGNVQSILVWGVLPEVVFLMTGNSCFDAFLLEEYVAEKIYRPSSDKYVRPTRQTVEIKQK